MNDATYDDWLKAKIRRDGFAYMLARAYVAGNTEDAARQADKFTAAEAEMDRLDKELNK